MENTVVEKKEERFKKPEWLRVKLPTGENYLKVRSLVDQHKLHTICESGNCPNMGECWGAGTATFMILGNICTRSCGFCAVATGRAMTVNAIRQISPGTTLETLIPDFKGEMENVQRIVDVMPEIVSHNMETVRRLTRQVRIQAKYDRSLDVLKYLKEGGCRTKSGIMVGLGESDAEVLETMDDLARVGVEIMTIGQYLQPTKKHLAVQEFVHPEKFARYKEEALKRGFRYVESGPLVRSSYHAEQHI
ncbi:MAG: lipoyl synthase [Bacteroidetes bacterium]|nr:lipoyl synthase [Bacteroidota bacterium]